MKSICNRFEFQGELGIYDNVSSRYVNLDGSIKQIKGLREVQFSDATKKLLTDFIASLVHNKDDLTKKIKQERLKSNFLFEFNKNLNEGYL